MALGKLPRRPMTAYAYESSYESHLSGDIVNV
jgi:hypothetical protein